AGRTGSTGRRPGPGPTGPAAAAGTRLPAGWAAGLHEPGVAGAGGGHPARRLLARPRAPVRPWAPVRPGQCQPRACPRRRRSQTASPGGRATARTIPSAVSAASAPWLEWSPARFTTTPVTGPVAPVAGPGPQFLPAPAAAAAA